jgi:hypothetical protein
MVRSRWQLEDGNWATISAWDAAAQMGHSSLTYLQEYYDKGPAQMRIPIDQEINWRKVLEGGDMDQEYPVFKRHWKRNPIKSYAKVVKDTGKE